MAIDPLEVRTVSIDQLPTADFDIGNYLTHGIGADLKKNTVQALANFLTPLLGTISGIGFRAVSVPDGGSLPSTTQEEFILVGAGTFTNVGGGADITTTEQLNALVSNGSYWFIGVEIPITAEALGITQFIRSGFLNTSPSEDAVFNALALKLDMADLNTFTITDQVVTIAATQTFTIPSGQKPIAVYVNGALVYKTTSNNAALTNRWSQTGNDIILTKPTAVNNYVYIISQ